MNSISPYIPLALGIVAGVMFVALLLGMAAATMRNRRIIKKHFEQHDD